MHDSTSIYSFTQIECPTLQIDYSFTQINVRLYKLIISFIQIKCSTLQVDSLSPVYLPFNHVCLLQMPFGIKKTPHSLCFLLFLKPDVHFLKMLINFSTREQGVLSITDISLPLCPNITAPITVASSGSGVMIT